MSIISEIQRISDAKYAIISKIIAMGGVANPSHKIDMLSDDMSTIPTSGIPLAGCEFYSEPENVAEVLLDYKQNIKKFVDLRQIDKQNLTDRQFENLPHLEEFIANWTSINTGVLLFNANGQLKTVKFPYLNNTAAVLLHNTFEMCGNLEEVDLGNVQRISAVATFNMCVKLKSVKFGTLQEFSGNVTFLQCRALTNISVGPGTNIDLDFSSWEPIDAINEGKGDEINANIMANIVNNIQQDGGHTIRVSSLLYRVLTVDTVNAVSNKGWTIQSI